MLRDMKLWNAPAYTNFTKCLTKESLSALPATVGQEARMASGAKRM